MLSEGIMMPLGALLMSLMIGWEIGGSGQGRGRTARSALAPTAMFEVCVKVITRCRMLLIPAYGQVMSFFPAKGELCRNTRLNA